MRKMRSSPLVVRGSRASVAARKQRVFSRIGKHIIRRFLYGISGRSCPILILVLVAGTLVSRASDSSAEFDHANQLYEERKYSEAAAAYERLARGSHISAALYFNLGNALLKSGQLGRAILHYRLAQQLAPRDPDIRANLQIARLRVNNPNAIAPRWRLWTRSLSLNELTLLAVTAFWIWFALLALGEVQASRKRGLRKMIFSAAVLTVFFGLWLAWTWYEQVGARPAVVVSREAVVRLGPFEESQSAFLLQDGAEVEIKGVKQDWFEIKDTAGRTGWVRQDQIAALRRS